MFSEKLTKELKKLGINTANPPNVIRQELEDILDDRAQYINIKF